MLHGSTVSLTAAAPTLLQSPEGSIALIPDSGPVGASCSPSLYHLAVVLCSWV